MSPQNTWAWSHSHWIWWENLDLCTPAIEVARRGVYRHVLGGGGGAFMNNACPRCLGAQRHWWRWERGSSKRGDYVNAACAVRARRGWRVATRGWWPQTPLTVLAAASGDQWPPADTTSGVGRGRGGGGERRHQQCCQCLFTGVHCHAQGLHVHLRAPLTHCPWASLYLWQSFKSSLAWVIHFLH